MKLRILLLNIFLLTMSFSMLAAADFEPVDLFSSIFVPALNGFEKTTIETGLRGFWLRGDSFPGMRASKEVPSDWGIYLVVTVADEGPGTTLIDETKQKKGYVARQVRLPQEATQNFSLEIEFSYGSKARKNVVSAINKRIDELVKKYK